MKRNATFAAGFAAFLLVIGGALFFLRGNAPVKPAVLPPQDTVQEAPPVPPNEADRLKRAVHFKPGPDDAPDAPWTAGTVDDAPAMLDNKTGLVWGPRLDLPPLLRDMPSVTLGRTACAAQKPQGAWALPLADEMDLADRNGLKNADALSHHLWLVYTYDGTTVFPVARQWDSAYGPRPHNVRCVARAD